jgi:hypothetical protein
MEIQPADLGAERNLALIERRAVAYAATTRHGRRGRMLRALSSPGAGEPRLGLLGRFWARGTGLDDKDAVEAMRRMGSATTSMVAGMIGASSAIAFPAIVAGMNGHPGVALVFGAMWAAMASVGLIMPRALLHRWHKTPVTPHEIDEMLGESHDELERSYLALVRDALRQEGVTAEAADDVRNSIRALGEAIDRLPPVTTTTAADVATLRREAGLLRTKADAETDAVVGASLSRQAEARERSANAAEKSSLLLRRTAALRDELSAQTESLRLGLVALYSGAGDVADLSHLAATVRGVADEANAVADARAELDSPVVPLKGYAASPAVEAARVQELGRKV